MSTLYAGVHVAQVDNHGLAWMLKMPEVASQIGGSAFTSLRVRVFTTEDLSPESIVPSEESGAERSVHEWARTWHEHGKRWNRVAIVHDAYALAEDVFEITVDMCHRVHLDEHSKETFSGENARQDVDDQLHVLYGYVTDVLAAWVTFAGMPEQTLFEENSEEDVC